MYYNILIFYLGEDIMAYNFIEYQQNQSFLLPPSILDWVDEDGLAYFISDTLNAMMVKGKLDVFFGKYNKAGAGASAYHPLMMLKILIYSYCQGITSSRVIARKLETDVEMRFLAANLKPDFRTIADFRKNNVGAFGELFNRVLQLCSEAKMIKLGNIFIDGTKIKGNTSLASNRTREGIQKEVNEIMEKAAKIDELEDKKYGFDMRGDELPENLRKSEDRKKRLMEALERVEKKEAAEKAKEEKKKKNGKKEQPKNKAKKNEKPSAPKANITDPESRIMKTSRGYVQGYNAQIAVEGKNQIIIACSVTNQENDVKQLGVMIDECERQVGVCPPRTIADAGYWQPEIVKKYSEKTDLYLATAKSWKQRKAQKEIGFWPCGRKPKNLSPREEMERKLLTKKGGQTYKLRGQTVEPTIGQIKTRGCQNFSMRRREKVNGEWNIWCLTHNLIKLWKNNNKIAKK